MNNRILATLFALAVALFIGVAPVKAEAACAHNHYEKVEAKEPTCTQKGWTAYYKCLDCGLASETRNFKNPVKWTTFILDMTEHPDEDKDCVCDVCKASLEHKLSEKPTPEIQPTCEKDGEWGHYVCEVCNRLFSKSNPSKEVTAEAIVRPAIGHKPATDWSEDESGHWHACANDSEEQLDFAAHTFEQKFDGTNHWMECTVCGYKKDVTAHAWEWTSNGDYSGKHVATCTVCGKVYNAEGDACVDNDGDCHCDYCKAPMPHYWDASNMTYVAKKNPTCVEAGYPEHEECKICHVWIQYGDKVIAEADKVIPATGHTEASEWMKDASGHWHNCTVCMDPISTTKQEHTFEWVSDGDQHWQKCTVCGYETDKEGHDWDRVCNGDGTHTTKCTKCSAVMGNQTWECKDSPDDDDCVCDGCGGTVEHDKTQMNAHAPVEATCTETGTRGYWDCPFCGKLFVDGKDGKLEEVTDVTTEALDHDWKYVKDTLNGQHLQKCKRCGAYQTFGHVDSNGDCLCDIGGCGTPVHSHTYVHVARVEPTCGKEGTEEYLKYEGCGKMFDMNGNPIDAPAVIPALEHEWSEEWEVVEDGHAKKCVNCGELQAAEAHTDSDGDNRCDVCKVELTLDYVPQQDPTCTDIGYKEYWISPITGRMYADPNGKEFITARETIPATGHSYTISDGIYHVCDVCGHTQKHVADADYPCFCSICHLPLSGHEMTFVDTVVATCTKPGTKAYLACSCGRLYDVITGEEISAPISIPAIGHKLSSELVEDTRQGDHYQVCVHAGCDYEYHSEHEYEVEDPLKGNYHQFICACGHVETEVHYDKDGDNKCDECGHDMANTTVVVEQHDPVTVITGEKDTVDNTKTWWQNWWSNLTSSNAGSETSGNTATAASDSGSSTAGSSSGTSTGTPAASGGSSTTSGSSSASGSSNTGSTSGSASSTSGSGTTSAIDQLILFLTELLNKLITIR